MTIRSEAFPLTKKMGVWIGPNTAELGGVDSSTDATPGLDNPNLDDASNAAFDTRLLGVDDVGDYMDFKAGQNPGSKPTFLVYSDRAYATIGNTTDITTPYNAFVSAITAALQETRSGLYTAFGTSYNVKGVIWDYYFPYAPSSYPTLSTANTTALLHNVYQWCIENDLWFGIVTHADPDTSLSTYSVDWSYTTYIADFFCPRLYAQLDEKTPMDANGYDSRDRFVMKYLKERSTYYGTNSFKVVPIISLFVKGIAGECGQDYCKAWLIDYNNRYRTPEYSKRILYEHYKKLFELTYDQLRQDGTNRVYDMASTQIQPHTNTAVPDPHGFIIRASEFIGQRSNSGFGDWDRVGEPFYREYKFHDDRNDDPTQDWSKDTAIATPSTYTKTWKQNIQDLRTYMIANSQY